MTAAPESLHCMLCGDPIDPNRVFGLYGRMAPGEDVSDRVGDSVYLDVSGMPVMAVVAGEGAPIREQGFDVVFMLCGRRCEAAIRIAAGLDALDETGIAPDPEAPGVEGLKRTRPGGGRTERDIERFTRFENLLREVAPDIAARLGADDPLADIMDRMKNKCAWCLRDVGDEPVRLGVWFTERDTDQPGPESDFMSVKIGDRLLAARRPETGSADFGTCDAEFMLCCDDCLAAVTDLIKSDRRLSLVH